MVVSASGASARNLFVESKLRLAERIQFNVNSAGSVARQIIRGSKSNDVLMHTARNFALQEYALENSETNLKRMASLATHLHVQMEALQK
uniref:BLOC-1-related complex subunit 7 n=1 Tax=Strigamia maritima TaxID=126957 RepID=T1JJ24_STRMM